MESGLFQHLMKHFIRLLDKRLLADKDYWRVHIPLTKYESAQSASESTLSTSQIHVFQVT